MPVNQDGFPPGWDGTKVERVLTHYEGQSDEDALSEDALASERSDWVKFATLTDDQVRAGINLDPEIRPADEAFWKTATVVTPKASR